MAAAGARPFMLLAERVELQACSRPVVDREDVAAVGIGDHQHLVVRHRHVRVREARAGLQDILQLAFSIVGVNLAGTDAVRVGRRNQVALDVKQEAVRRVAVGHLNEDLLLFLAESVQRHLYDAAVPCVGYVENVFFQPKAKTVRIPWERAQQL